MQEKIDSAVIPCTCCGGTGSVPLTGGLLHAYQFAGSVNHEITSEMYERSDAELSRTNAANRLATLTQYGFLERRVDGRKCFYRRKQ